MLYEFSDLSRSILVAYAHMFIFPPIFWGGMAYVVCRTFTRSWDDSVKQVFLVCILITLAALVPITVMELDSSTNAPFEYATLDEHRTTVSALINGTGTNADPVSAEAVFALREALREPIIRNIDDRSGTYHLYVTVFVIGAILNISFFLTMVYRIIGGIGADMRVRKMNRDDIGLILIGLVAATFFFIARYNCWQFRSRVFGPEHTLRIMDLVGLVLYSLMAIGFSFVYWMSVDKIGKIAIAICNSALVVAVFSLWKNSNLALPAKLNLGDILLSAKSAELIGGLSIFGIVFLSLALLSDIVQPQPERLGDAGE